MKRPFLALALFAGGVMAGSSGLLRVYDWHTEWMIPYPRALTYRYLVSTEAEREWWPSMELVRSSPGDLGPGSFAEFRVHQAPGVARLAPPFRLRCVYTDVEPEQRLRQIVSGDLAGVLETHLQDMDGGRTRITFDWYVRMGNPILNLLSFVLTPLYRRSHDSVMTEGERGLREYCREHRA